MSTETQRAAIGSDAIHALAALSGLALIATGAWLSFGPGYGMLALGGILLAGVIWARRQPAQTAVEDDIEPVVMRTIQEDRE